MNEESSTTFEDRLSEVLVTMHPSSLTSTPPVQVLPVRSGFNLPRISVVGAAALLVVVALVVTFTPGRASRSAAATPAPLVLDGTALPAREALMELADRAAAQPPITEGDVWYQKTYAWYLNTAVGRDETTSWVTPRIIETLRYADGSGERSTRSGEPMDPSDRSSQGELAAIEALPGDGRAASVDHHDHLFVLDPPSVDPDQLRQQLQQLRPQAPPEFAIWEGVGRYLSEVPLDPEQNAAMLRVLATVEGAIHRGDAIDRAGRRVSVFTFDTSASGLPSRRFLLFDPATGALLGREQLLTTDPGALNVDVPAVISYEAIITNEWRAD